MSRILILGGAGGIGVGIVKKYVEMIENKKLDIIIGDIDEERGTKLQNMHKDIVSYYQVDLTKLSEIKEFRDNIKKTYESITHIVSLAGNDLESEFNGLSNTDSGTIDKSINLNLKSHINIVKSFSGLIDQDKSENKSITLISSINAIQDYGLPAYSSAKAGMIGFVNSTVGEFGENSIRINTVLPGSVRNERSLEEPKDNEKLAESTALNRLTTPEDVGNVVYSVTHLMTAVTGEEIVVDCGQTKMNTNYID